MKDYILVLKGSNKDLAKFEFETLWYTYFKEKIVLKELKNVIYIFSSDNDITPNHLLLRRLTYVNILSEIKSHFKNLDDFTENISKIDLSEYNGVPFRVRIKKSRKYFKVLYTEKDFAKPIWDGFENPKVSIDSYEVEFNFIFIEDIEGFYFAKKIYENEKDYLKRMPKLRPVAMPYTLKSDMSRACINLLGIKEGKILDPFCGVGGILLEAYDMGFDIIGNDISWNDLKYLKKNFDYYFPDSDYIRTLADSKTQFLKENTVDGIVTDIPYGKCSRRLGIDLYEGFLKSAKKYLKPGKRLIVIYANFVEFKSLAIKYFDEIAEIEEYINKDMTRYMLVLENVDQCIDS